MRIIFLNILHPPFSSNRFFCSSRHFLIFSGSSLVTDLVGAGDAYNSVTGRSKLLEQYKQNEI